MTVNAHGLLQASASPPAAKVGVERRPVSGLLAEWASGAPLQQQKRRRKDEPLSRANGRLPGSAFRYIRAGKVAPTVEEVGHVKSAGRLRQLIVERMEPVAVEENGATKIKTAPGGNNCASLLRVLLNAVPKPDSA